MEIIMIAQNTNKIKRQKIALTSLAFLMLSCSSIPCASSDLKEENKTGYTQKLASYSRKELSNFNFAAVDTPNSLVSRSQYDLSGEEIDFDKLKSAQKLLKTGKRTKSVANALKIPVNVLKSLIDTSSMAAPDPATKTILKGVASGVPFILVPIETVAKLTGNLGIKAEKHFVRTLPPEIAILYRFTQFQEKIDKFQSRLDAAENRSKAYYKTGSVGKSLDDALDKVLQTDRDEKWQKRETKVRAERKVYLANLKTTLKTQIKQLESFTQEGKKEALKHGDLKGRTKESSMYYLDLLKDFLSKVEEEKHRKIT